MGLKGNGTDGMSVPFLLEEGSVARCTCHGWLSFFLILNYSGDTTHLIQGRGSIVSFVNGAEHRCAARRREYIYVVPQLEELQMNNCQTAFRVSLFAAMTVIFVSFAHAQATRTWVSGVGDDVNPCSRTAPCKTFAGAISKTAAGGEINVIDAGGFGAVYRHQINNH